MEKAKVYFTDMRVRAGGDNLLQKLDKLLEKAGMGNIDFKDKFVAIKLHFGEYGNLSFLRPNYAKVVADVVKRYGGKPFLTDCNTLYVGSRKDALEHLNTANINGFGPLSTGCQNIIADGLKGTDEVYVTVPGGEYIKEAKIGHALMEADIIITLTHFKGHEMTGFGGTIKNIGMGGGSRAGKMEMHCDGKPAVREDKCIGCGMCRKACAHSATVIENKKCHIDQEKCVGCGRCIGVCPTNAIIPTSWNAGDMVNLKMAEYACAILHDRPQFHISLIVDVSPNCDCHSENDAAIVPNIGMLASFDPVAIDQAGADLVNKAPVIGNSMLGENIEENPQEAKNHDHFYNNHPDTQWQSCLEHCVKLQMGSRSYELIKL